MRVRITNRYADDTVVLADNKSDLQKNYGSDHTTQWKIRTAHEHFQERIDWFYNKLILPKRFWSMADILRCEPKREMRSRTEQVKTIFTRMKHFLPVLIWAWSSECSWSGAISSVYFCMVVMAGLSIWELRERSRLFEMYSYHRMLRISWIHRVANEEVLRRIKKSNKL